MVAPNTALALEGSAENRKPINIAIIAAAEVYQKWPGQNVKKSSIDI
jgi:hypothetical protein